MTGNQVIAAVYLACAALLFAIAYLVLKEDLRKRINRITGLMFGFAAFGPFFQGLGQFLGEALQEGGAITNVIYVWELFFPQLIFFALCFPTETRFFNRFSRLKYAIFIPHLFHLLLTTIFSKPENLAEYLNPDRMGAIGKAVFGSIETVTKILILFLSVLLESHAKLFSIVNFAYVIFAAAILYQGTKRVTAPQLRKQVIIVIYGMISALVLYLVAFVLPGVGLLELPPAAQSTVTILALILGCGSIVWAIVRYRFMDVRLIVRQSLVYTVTSAVVVGAYLLIIRQVGDFMTSVFGREVRALDVILIIVLLLLFQPVMSQMDDLIRKLFIKDKSDFRNISQYFSRKAATVFEPSELFALSRDVLRNQLLIESSQIYLKEENQPQLRLVTSAGEDSPPQLYSVQEKLLFELARRGTVANFDEIAAFDKGSSLTRDLADQRTRLIVPLISGDGLLGFLAVGEKISGYRMNYEDITTLSTMADQLAITITTSRLHKESIEKQRLEEEMNIARTIQQELLPRIFPSGSDFRFTAYSLPARHVGGDYFDFIKTPRNTLGVVLADASGKGMPAALLASQLQAAIRSEVRHNLEPSQMLKHVNDLVHGATASEHFATLFFADFDPQTKILSYCNAGHNYPILVSGSGNVAVLEKGGMLLGAFPEIPYEQGEVEMQKDDVLFFYTDGLNEAVNSDGDQYGEERITEVLCRNRQLTPEQIQGRMIEDVRRFAAGEALQDDMTLIVLKVL